MECIAITLREPPAPMPKIARQLDRTVLKLRSMALKAGGRGAVNLFTLEVWFVLGCVVVTAGLIGWGAWSLFWHLYDEHMQAQKRIANSQLDSAWTTRQFYIPYSQRDFK